MTPDAERTPATRWELLLALSQRWYMRVTVVVLGILALFRLIPNRLILTFADVVFLAGWILIMVGRAILAVPQVNEELASWPDTRWARWAKPIFEVGIWAAIGPFTLAVLCLPFVFIYPKLMDTPFSTVAGALALIGGIPALLISAVFILLALVAFAIALPIGIARATARARRRRHYDYPPHLPRR